MLALEKANFLLEPVNLALTSATHIHVCHLWYYCFPKISRVLVLQDVALLHVIFLKPAARFSLLCSANPSLVVKVIIGELLVLPGWF